MIEKIEKFPKIPDTLRLASLQRKLVPFIGAGVSQLGGCPGWNEFADGALRFFIDNKKLSHAQFNQISSLSSRVKLSIALELEKQNNLKIDFKSLLKPSDNKNLGDKIYGSLSRLAKTFVTTNYDEWLDIIPPDILSTDELSSSTDMPKTSRKTFFRYNELSVENLDVQDAVFHIHGSMNERDSMVITTVDYLDRYSSHQIDGNQNRENSYLTFLQTLFRLKNVLFIGYGLSELEVLEYIFQKGVSTLPDDNEEPKHYVIQGFFTHEIEIARRMEGYFLQFGIGLLPFSRDEMDWEQLCEVIESLSRKIPPGPPLQLPKRLEMEELLS